MFRLGFWRKKKAKPPVVGLNNPKGLHLSNHNRGVINVPVTKHDLDPDWALRRHAIDLHSQESQLPLKPWQWNCTASIGSAGATPYYLWRRAPSSTLLCLIIDGKWGLASYPDPDKLKVRWITSNTIMIDIIRLRHARQGMLGEQSWGIHSFRMSGLIPPVGKWWVCGKRVKVHVVVCVPVKVTNESVDVWELPMSMKKVWNLT